MVKRHAHSLAWRGAKFICWPSSVAQSPVEPDDGRIKKYYDMHKPSNSHMPNPATSIILFLTTDSVGFDTICWEHRNQLHQARRYLWLATKAFLILLNVGHRRRGYTDESRKQSSVLPSTVCGRVVVLDSLDSGIQVGTQGHTTLLLSFTIVSSLWQRSVDIEQGSTRSCTGVL